MRRAHAVVPVALVLALVAPAVASHHPPATAGSAARLAGTNRAKTRSGAGSHQPSIQSRDRLRAEGRAFRIPNGSRFAWRGLTSFRLLEMVAHARASEAERVLDWAASQGMTLVRVLGMADILFQLTPAEGRAALPTLLDLAARRELRVEVVALADTGRIPVDVAGQVAAVGAICSQHGNCLLEIANEPWHPTQQRGLASPHRLLALRSLVPAIVPVSLGSPGEIDAGAYAGGDFLTIHVERSNANGGWGHVLRMGDAAALGARLGKPVVDDEPIGAAERSEPGRRDSDAARWYAKGLLARLLALGATFHYEGGLQSQLPRGAEADCLAAWRRGLEALPAGVEDRIAAVEPGTAGSAVASIDRQAALAIYLAQGDSEAWVGAVGVTRPLALRWQSSWKAEESTSYRGVTLLRASRR